MLLSALGFALMSACVKYVSTYGIPVFEIVAARALSHSF
ncbi:metabolite transporter (DMT) superfamily [Vibrio astriarenae]|nr:metabolite transporter (DMT) superfamily [Vibrio sp. C7]